MTGHLVHRTVAALRVLLSLVPDDLDTSRGDDGHIVEHLVVVCSDGHFLKFLTKWIGRVLGGRADLLAVPGGPLELCLDSHTVESMLDRAKTLHGLHKTTHIWFIFHNRCGGYAKHRGTTDVHVERAQQLQDMVEIERLMSEDGQIGADTLLHFGILRTRGPGFAPLGELLRQAIALGLHISALERDVAGAIPELPV